MEQIDQPIETPRTTWKEMQGMLAELRSMTRGLPAMKTAVRRMREGSDEQAMQRRAVEIREQEIATLREKIVQSTRCYW